jgi:hypothetical protein
MLKNVFFCGLLLCFSLCACSQNSAAKKDTTYFNIIKIIPSNYYTKHLGFFCTNEWRLQKATGVNLFLRLGTKEYVDYLERKPNAIKQLY